MSPARIAAIVGVSESTLKRWVDAGVLRARKTAGGHRRIALAEVLAFFRASGRPAPSLQALDALATRPSAAGDRGATPETLADLLLGDEAVAQALLFEDFRRGRPLEDILDRLLGPAMVRIGALWSAGSIDVYQEHLATRRAWWILVALRGLLPEPAADARLALGATPAGDPSLLPSLMAELALVEAGWRTLNLGPDTPVASMRKAVETHRPRLLWISLTAHGVPSGFIEEYPALRDAARAVGAAVMVGGQGVTAQVQDALDASAFGTRVAHLKAFARDLR
jgi:excisionase family DNA binding protein